MTDTLKPVNCGCGGEAKVQRVRTLKAHVLVVMCKKCQIATDYYTTETEAVEAWNRAMGAKDINVPNKERTAKAKVNFKDENYFFGWCECGQYQNSQYPYCPACGCRLEWE